MTLDDIVERLPKALDMPWPFDPAAQGSPFYQVHLPVVLLLSCFARCVMAAPSQSGEVYRVLPCAALIMQRAERRDACDCQVYVREIASMNLLLNTMLQSLQQLELALQVCLLSCPWTPFVGALLAPLALLDQVHHLSEHLKAWL